MWADAYLTGQVINNMFQDYPFLYDRETLAHLLRLCRFGELMYLAPGQSDDPELMGVERHGRVVSDESINNFETLTVEARKI